MSLGMASVKTDSDSGVIKPRAEHAGIHGNSVRGNHPPDTVTRTKSVEVFTKSTNEGGKGGRKSITNVRFGTRNKLPSLTRLKRTTYATQETPSPRGA